MLQTLRDKIQGWIAGTIIGLIIITFALWGIHNYVGTGGGEVTVAKVNGKAITEAQLNTAYERLRNSLQAQANAPLALTSAQQAALKHQALEQLINMQVLTQAAVKRGYRISQAEMDSAIMQMPEFQANGQFSTDRFSQILNASGFTQEQFLSVLSSSLVVNQVQTGVTGSTFALPTEVQATQQLLDQQRDIGYVILPANSFVTTANASPADIQAYYQQHQDEFKTAEKVQIEYIELDADKIQANVKLNPKEIEQYYQDNQAAFTKNGTLAPFAHVKDQITKTLTLQKAQQMFSEQSQQLSDLTFTNPNSLAPAANALGLKIVTSDYLAKQSTPTGLAANPKVLNAAFSDDVVKQNNNSNPITIADGKVIVLRAKNYQPATVLPLAQVQDKIAQQLKHQAAQNTAMQTGQKIVAAIQQGQAPSNLAQQYHATWKTANAASRQAAGINAQVLRAAFALPKPQSQKLSVIGIQLANGDYAVVTVTGVQDAALNKSSQQATVLKNELASAYGQLDYLLYVNDLLKQAKIKINVVNGEPAS